MIKPGEKAEIYVEEKKTGLQEKSKPRHEEEAIEERIERYEKKKEIRSCLRDEL